MKNGHIKYGEDISLNSHSIQAAIMAKKRGLNDEYIAAAFLHDIGHVCQLAEETEMMGDFGAFDHEEVGANFLEAVGFCQLIVSSARYHVDAKRYLCAINPIYFDELSEASAQTLLYQGGVMSPAEVRQFRTLDYFKEIILLRKIDDEAKDPYFRVKDEHWDFIKLVLLNK